MALRTKNAIRRSFIELLAERPFDKISVRDIADGDLVEGTLCQKLDEAAADGVFGAQSHG